MRTTIILLALFVCSAAFAQSTKQKARVSALYTKVMNEDSFISLSAKYKTKSGIEPATDVVFNVYRSVSSDSLVYIGKAKTSADGKAKFGIDLGEIKGAEPGTVFSYIVKIENNDRFEDNETTVRFSEANLTAVLQTSDGVSQIKATLTDASSNPLPGQPINVGLKRMYGLLQMGEESYQTDESGSVLVPVIDSMPGIDGKLAYEVALNESDTYGTVKAIVRSATGIPIRDQSTFDQRTMWSPPLKAPLYLLTFPNLIILGVWIPLIILIFNLYRISKSS